MPRVGEVWLDNDFFGDGTKRKYLLILAVAAGDVTFRLLTSQQKGRPEVPPCHHGDPFAGFYVGALGGPLTKPTWLDLDDTDDMDDLKFGHLVGTGKLSRVMDISPQLLCPALRCAANAPDTSRRQRARILDSVQTLGCP